MKLRLFAFLLVLFVSLLLCSCKDDADDVNTPAPSWITVPQYSFPIYIAQRGGIVTTSLETFDITGFMEVGDSVAFTDSLEWKVLPYDRTKSPYVKNNFVLYNSAVKKVSRKP
jgi:hypothetical protein